MTTQSDIDAYIAAQPDAKRDELAQLHALIRRVAPDARLWFLDGRNEAGKVVSNPNIGYGAQTMKLAGGKTREFYQVGLSANTTGVSLYIMGVGDKTYLARTWGARLGKASVSGYCVKFRSLEDLDLAVLEEMIRFGLGA
jgi:hypothetical protein